MTIYPYTTTKEHWSSLMTLQINPSSMAKTPTLFFLCFLANIILTKSDVLKLPLIHPLSPESPFFRSNLTDEERIRISVLQSESRGNYFSKASRMEVDTQFYHYIVKVRIGTFKSKPPYKEYYLEMDTGSSLTWLQCEGCTKCFKQMQKPFPKQNSSSFRPLIINGKQKYFRLGYADGSSTTGLLAHESFYLRSNAGDQKVENLRFGCALESFMSYGNTKNNRMAGLIGLGTSDSSLVKQLDHLSNGKFSYCLPLRSSRTQTYLTFGETDKPLPNTARAAAMYTKSDAADGYFADLQGISINRTRLNIRFAEPTVPGSCVIDSGTPYSRLVSPAFDAVKQQLEKYFAPITNLKKVKKDMELCYERTSRPVGFDGLPSITFHFRGQRADFEMAPAAVFDVVPKSMFRREYFCLAMIRHEKMSFLGSYQQSNHRIIYDTKNKQLVFYREDCSRNP